MRLSPRFKLSCSFAQRAAVCPLIIAPAFKRRTIALCPKHLTWPRHFFSPRLRKYARSPALCAPAGKPFLMAKPPLPCRKIFACACLSALFAFSSPWFFSFPPFLSTCFCQIHRFFIRKVLAAFHWCAAKPICLPRPFFMRRVLSSKPMPPCFPFSLIGLSQAYPLNHAAFRPLRRRFLFS